MFEAWEIYKGLLRKCPYYDVPRWSQVNQFFDGLKMPSRVILDAPVGGSFSKKSDIEASELLEDMASNSTLWPSEGLQPTKRVARILDLDVFTNLATQVSILTTQLQSNYMTANVVHTHLTPICEPRSVRLFACI